jgi:hypothetical protein
MNRTVLRPRTRMAAPLAARSPLGWLGGGPRYTACAADRREFSRLGSLYDRVVWVDRHVPSVRAAPSEGRAPSRSASKYKDPRSSRGGLLGGGSCLTDARRYFRIMTIGRIKGGCCWKPS